MDSIKEVEIRKQKAKDLLAIFNSDFIWPFF